MKEVGHPLHQARRRKITLSPTRSSPTSHSSGSNGYLSGNGALAGGRPSICLQCEDERDGARERRQVWRLRVVRGLSTCTCMYCTQLNRFLHAWNEALTRSGPVDRPEFVHWMVTMCMYCGLVNRRGTGVQDVQYRGLGTPTRASTTHCRGACESGASTCICVSDGASVVAVRPPA